MTKLFPVQSQRDFLLEAVTALARANAEQETAVAGSLLDDCLTSLVLEEMKKTVRFHARAGYRNQGTLLDQALDQVERLLYRHLAWQQDGCPDWNWRQVRETLKQPALCLEALQANLMAANREHPLPEEQRVTEGTEVPFDILVLMDYETEGLVAVPIESEQCHLDLERVQAQEGWVVTGSYFPFEVIAGDFIFVISDAGEIILQTHHFPASLIEQARQILTLLAQCLYTKGQSPFFVATMKSEECQDSYEEWEPDEAVR
ncbi:hypothetical protein H6F86_10675 [Phormidium sp. FACHB-592]|uniref:Uncharacterized protein n=1 Tax=Stenomitos frigidus AS-A4 TaxID=2933935 RepID=A0ABV0KUF1_9CYAN|nr:hypothetical protein [Phormidium sp. FACHB-592]MBD2074341.1 hypothetical protein [Phormidium sp. FACHB-592]